MRTTLLSTVFAIASGLPSTAQTQPWRFVSIPDFQNNDIGSLADPQSGFPQNPTLPAGFVALDAAWDSCTAHYHDSVDWIVSQLALERPEFTLVAGDLVMGHWDHSSDGRFVFGPMGNDGEVRAALDRAADYYYDIWLGRFDPARNAHLANALNALGLPQVPMTVHTTVGDHELGDNNWSVGGIKSRMVPAYKQAFARWFTQLPAGSAVGTPRYAQRPVGTVYEDTAFAFQHRNVLFVIVDVWRQDAPNTSLGSTGSVLATVDDGLPGTTNDDQLAWLDAVLAQGRQDPTVDFIVVQGHPPVLRPVRARNSSNLGLVDQNGNTQYDTQFWQLLSQYKVDVYFCGEVHDITLSRYGHVTQIVHGALIGNHSPINYLTVDVHPDRLEFTAMEIDVDLASGNLWQTGSNRPRADLDIPASRRQTGYQPTGRAVLTKVPTGGSDVTVATGRLAPYGTFEQGGSTPWLVGMPLDALQGGVYENRAQALGSGTPEGQTSIVPGVLGNAVRMGPGQGRVLTSSSPIGGARERTVTAWVRTSVTSGLATVLTMGSNGTGTKWDVDVDASSGGVLELGVGSGRTVGQGARINDGQWHLVTTVLPTNGTDLSDVRLFVDGVFQYRGNATRAIATSGGPLILGHAANGDYFQNIAGDVDDVSVWAEAFTDAHVKSLYDVAVAPGLHYDAEAFEALLEVYRGNVARVTLGAFTWRRATGLSGNPGWNPQAVGGHLVFDPTTGEGLTTFDPGASTVFGSACPGTNALSPAIGSTGSPTLGSSAFRVTLANARPLSSSLLVIAPTRIDLPLGGTCTAYPLPGVLGIAATTSLAGDAFLALPIPTEPSLVSQVVYNQWFVLDPQGAFGPGIGALSAGLQVRIGQP